MTEYGNPIVDYLSIEKFPLTNNEIKTLKMKCTLPAAKNHDFFDQLQENTNIELLHLNAE